MHDGISVYSSPDLTKWRLEGTVTNGGTYSPEPRVFGNPITNDYVMLSHDPRCGGFANFLAVSRSQDPVGPFENVGCLNTTRKILSDWNLWSDPLSKKGYIIYNAYVSYYGDPNTAMYVEQFADDYLSIVPNSQPAVIGQDWCTKAPEPRPVGKPEW